MFRARRPCGWRRPPRSRPPRDSGSSGELGVPERRRRQAETGMNIRLARRAGRRAGAAVIGHFAADDLSLLALADRRVVIPGELDAGLVAAVPVAVVVAERLHLLVGDLGQALVREAERGAPQAGRPLQILAAALVIDIDPPAARDDDRPFLLVPHQTGLRMDEMRNVARVYRIRGDVGHGLSPCRMRDRWDRS